MRGEFWRRVGVALTPFIFVFLGMGFGTVRTRAVRAGAALVAMVVLIAYWALQATMTIQMMQGKIPPLLAMMTPNLIMAIAGAVSFRRASW
jgi:lipopolysaccharide export LptBFGC system permease protein LptF